MQAFALSPESKQETPLTGGKIQINNNAEKSQLQLNRETCLFSNERSQIQQPFYSFQASVSRNAEIPMEEKNEQDQNSGLIRNHQWSEIVENEVKDLPIELRMACKDIAMEVAQRAELDHLRLTIEERTGPLYLEFCKAFDNLTSDIDFEESINTYSQILVRYWNEEMFFQHFVQNKYLSLLMAKVRERKYAPDAVKAVFGCLEYLLKGLKSEPSPHNADSKEQQFIYLLVMIYKEGFITENYKFSQSEDWAYYAHFMKLLVRVINQADKAQELNLKAKLNTKQNQISDTITLNPSPRVENKFEYEERHSKYLTIFFNQKTPEFPLVLKLLYFYKWSDAILQTSVKLCLLQISNHPNRKLQRYLLNFPFITFYLLYCTKISDNIEKCLTLGGTRPACERESEKEETLLEEIVSDIKFMEDYLRVEDEEPSSPRSHRAHSVHQHLNMYINAFVYYAGRGFYQVLSRFAVEENIDGLINGMILMTKVLRINTILKIKLGFEEMLHKYINCDLWTYLKLKRERLDNEKYWIFDQCQDIIREHAENVLYGESEGQEAKDQLSSYSKASKSVFQSESLEVVQLSPPSVSKSMVGSKSSKKPSSYSSMVFKAMRSYIPTTNYSWLNYELKKMSEVLGLEVSLNREVEHFGEGLASNTFYKESFLFLIDKIQEYHYHGSNKMVLKSKKSLLSRFSSPIKPNPLFASIASTAHKVGIKHSNSGSKASEGAKKVYEDSGEELIYYYLVLMCSIKDDEVYRSLQSPRGEGTENINLEEISDLLKITKKCKSLMLVGMMYWYIKLLDYQLHETNFDFSMINDDREPAFHEDERTKGEKKEQEDTLAAELLENYLQSMSKLVYYILTQGWDTFVKHTREIKKVIWGSEHEKQKGCEYENSNRNPATQFSNDIFRDVECDIVYFVMLRHIFGTRNKKGEVTEGIDGALEDKDVISKQIKVPCRLTNCQGDQAYLIMDGQYIQFSTRDDLPITKKPLSVSSFNIYYQEVAEQPEPEGHPIKPQIKEKGNRNAVFELVDKSINGECFTVYFEEVPIREYVAKEIKWRKKITMDIEMSLRTIKFDID